MAAYKAPTFTVDGKTYEMRLDLARLSLFERNNKSLMQIIVQNQGMFAVDEILNLAAVSIKSVDGGYVAVPQGKEMATKLMETNGYGFLLEQMVEVLQHDCGFFFKQGTNA